MKQFIKFFQLKKFWRSNQCWSKETDSSSSTATQKQAPNQNYKNINTKQTVESGYFVQTVHTVAGGHWRERRREWERKTVKTLTTTTVVGDRRSGKESPLLRERTESWHLVEAPAAMHQQQYGNSATLWLLADRVVEATAVDADDDDDADADDVHCIVQHTYQWIHIQRQLALTTAVAYSQRTNKHVFLFHTHSQNSQLLLEQTIKC